MQLGMISQIVDPPENLREEAQTLAEKIARNSPAAMRGLQAGAVGRAGDRASPTPAARARGDLVSMWGHPDQEEGPQAFAAKREAEVAAARCREDRRHRTGPALMASLLDLLEERAGRRRDDRGLLRGRGRSPGPPCARRRRTWRPRSAAAGVKPGPAGRGHARERSRGRRGHVRRLVRGCGVRADQPAGHGVRTRALPVGDPARRCSSRGRRPPTSSVPDGDRGGAVVDRRRRAPRVDVPAHEGDIALVQWTSGTTGRPKPVLLRHSGFLKLLEPVLKKLLGAGSDTIAERKAPMPNLIPTSMALSAGIYNVLFAFRVGAAAILMERFDPIVFVRARAALPAAFDGAAAGGHDDALRHPRGDDARAAEVRAQHQRAALAAAGAPVPRQVRRHGAELLRPDRDRRRDRRLERGRFARVRRGEARLDRPPARGRRGAYRGGDRGSCTSGPRDGSRLRRRRTARRSRHAPTAGFAPATSPASTRRASSGSRAASRT